MQDKSAPVARILPEISQSRYPVREEAPVFPDNCPACGAGVSSRGNFFRPVTYSCGAAYTEKPQIQNHTDKWWGSCRAGV